MERTEHGRGAAPSDAPAVARSTAGEPARPPPTDSGPPPGGGSRRIPLTVGAGVVLVLALGGLMIWRAESRTNKIALSSAPTPVTVVKAGDTPYREVRSYIGTVRPWVEASVGPQFISAYVLTVLVRPGAVVKAGQVLATLDCRNESSASEAISSEARAIEARQKAIADEAARTQKLLSGGFVSENSVEMKLAKSAAEEASLAAQRASLAQSTLRVSDCVLRAPFDGEVGNRFADPGAFVRPGMPIVTVVDRSTVRMVGDAPESDFAVVSAGTPVRVRLLSSATEMKAAVTRRAPTADPGTRTVHFEIDVSDPKRTIPVNTTMEVRVDVGTPVPASSIPIYAATVANAKATMFTVKGDVASSLTVVPIGEIEGRLYFHPADLAPGTEVVTEGRALLSNGAKVAAHEAPAPVHGSHAEIIPDGGEAHP